MAIYNAGYLSPIRKKLGNAVGRKWRNLDVLSVYQPNVSNPRTAAQQINRFRFGALSSIAMNVATALKLGFEAVTRGTKVPVRSYFIKSNWSKVSATAQGVVTVTYPDLIFSKGGLPMVQFGNPSFSDPLEVVVPLADSGSATGADPADDVYMLIYDADNGESILSEPKKRNDEEIVVLVPDYWNGHHVHCYGFGIGGGTENKGIISNTRYLGAGTIS